MLRHSGRVGGAGRQGRDGIAVEVCGRETHRHDDRHPRSAQPGRPAPPATDEYIAMPQEFDAALAAVAAKFPGLVFVGPKTEAPSCAAFDGGGPHLTNEGNAAVAKAIGAYFVKHQ